MEKKITDKSNREEELEEQNLQLREVTKVMSTQIEKIEQELESKLLKKDDLIRDLQERLEQSKNVNKYNDDLDQDMKELEAMESQLNSQIK